MVNLIIEILNYINVLLSVPKLFSFSIYPLIKQVPNQALFTTLLSSPTSCQDHIVEFNPEAFINTLVFVSIFVESSWISYHDGRGAQHQCYSASLKNNFNFSQHFPMICMLILLILGF